MIPNDAFRRYLPMLAFMLIHRLRPRATNDFVVLVKQFAIDPIVFREFRIGGLRRVSILLLADGGHVARLIAAGEPGNHAALRKVVEHRKILGQ